MKDPHDPPSDTAAEDLPVGRAVAVGVASLVIFGIAIAWAGSILRERSREILPSGVPAIGSEMGREEIGIVNQRMFDVDRRVELTFRRDRERLASYGWVDRANGVVHVPIDEAMKQVVAEAGR